jgi:hypothetical protein
MIQRIQSLFLLFVMVFSIAIVLHPINRMVLSNGPLAIMSSFSFKALVNPPILIIRTFPIAILAILSAIFSFWIILKYQNRDLQMKLCVYNIIFNFLIIIAILTYYYIIKHSTYENNITVIKSAFSYPILLPLINIILLFQSFRAIRRDDLLIKSYDRLRD